MLLAAGAAQAQDGPVRLANLDDPSSPGASWRNGLELALREINARGGILNRPVVLSHATAPEAAMAGRPFLVLAPRAPAREPDVPVLSAERLAGGLARQGERLAVYIAERLKATSVALIAADSPAPRELREGVTRGLAARRVAVAAEIASESDQVDFSAIVLRAKGARADALVALVDEAAAARLLTELRRQGYERPVIGGAALAGAGALGDGLKMRAAVGLHPAAPVPPVRDMVRAYEHAYDSRPDATALAGYSALYVVKAVAERVGTLDTEAFARALKGAQLSAREHPGVLVDVAFDELGYGHRAALIVERRGDGPAVVDMLPPY